MNGMDKLETNTLNAKTELTRHYNRFSPETMSVDQFSEWTKLLVSLMHKYAILRSSANLSGK